MSGVESGVNSQARLPVGPTDRVVRCPRPVMAGRRERRRPAEAPPLCETRRWTRLFRKFTGGAWERQASPRGIPLWRHAPRWTRRTWAIHPAALSRLLRGVASRDQPQGNPHYHSGSRRWTQLSLGVGHGSLLLRTLLLIARTFFDAFSRTFSARFGTLFWRILRAGTAQPTNQKGVAGAPPLFGSAWGPSRWSSGRPSHRLGPVVLGSFPSDLAIHGNRTGGRSAGAALTT